MDQQEYQHAIDGMMGPFPFNDEQEGHFEHLKAILLTIGGEVEAMKSTQGTMEDDGRDMDIGEFEEPENAEDRAFVVADGPEAPIIHASKRKNHQLFNALQQDDSEEDEAVIMKNLNLTAAKKPVAAVNAVVDKHTQLDKFLVGDKHTVHFADPPHELMDVSSDENADEEEVEEDAEKTEDDESEPETTAEPKAKKKKSNSHEPKADPGMYKVGATFRVGGSEYKVTHAADKLAPHDGTSIDWERVNLTFCSTVYGPRPGKRDVDDYNTVVFSSVLPPQFVTVKQARDMVNALEKSVEKDTRTRSVDNDNLKKFDDGRVRTYIGMNYFRQLQAKRGRPKPKAQKDQAEEPGVDQLESQRDEAKQFMRELMDGKDMFKALPQAFTNSMGKLLKTCSMKKFKESFGGPPQEWMELMRSAKPGASMEDLVTAWLKSYLTSAVAADKEKIQFFIRNTMFVNAMVKELFTARLKVLSG